MRLSIIIEAEIGGQECLKLTLFLESHFWVSQPKSMSGHFRIRASPIHVSIGPYIVRTTVSNLRLESE
jgi:hypothetical protein